MGPAVGGAWSFSSISDGWHGGYLLDLNKGGGTRIPSPAEMKIYQMPVSTDMAEVSCSRMLWRRTILGVSRLEIAGSEEFSRMQPCFLSDHLVSEGALQSSGGCYHHMARFSFHGEVSQWRISWKPIPEDKQWCFESLWR
jgi:hypothetical protein